MARGKTFGQVVAATRAEAGQSANTAVGRNTHDQVEQTVRRVYERLHGDFHWPHLAIERDVTVEAGQRYYSFPDDLDPDRVGDAWVLEHEGAHWRPVSYGIGPEHWNSHNPERDERADPVRAWQRHNPGSGNKLMVEVWPLPDSSGGLLRLQGMPFPRSLTSDEDFVDLDDQAIALQAAGEILARHNSADSEIKLQQAQSRVDMIRSHQHASNPVFSMNPRRRTRPGGIQVRAPRT